MLCNNIIRTAIWEKNKQGMQDFNPTLLPSNLVVYLNKEAFERNDPARPGLQLPANIGKSDDDAVWILVPSLPDTQGVYLE